MYHTLFSYFVRKKKHPLRGVQSEFVLAMAIGTHAKSTAYTTDFEPKRSVRGWLAGFALPFTFLAATWAYAARCISSESLHHQKNGLPMYPGSTMSLTSYGVCWRGWTLALTGIS